MIGPGNMGDVLGAVVGHVAAGAVGILRMVRGGKAPCAVTGEALLSKEGDPFRRGRGEMRIVATGAGHPVAAHPFAHALAELLHLTYAACFGIALCVHKICEVVGDGIAGSIVQSVTAGALDGHVTFQMATDADRIPAFGSEGLRDSMPAFCRRRAHVAGYRHGRLRR